jgi:hypothetical protein
MNDSIFDNVQKRTILIIDGEEIPVEVFEVSDLPLLKSKRYIIRYPSWQLTGNKGVHQTWERFGIVVKK